MMIIRILYTFLTRCIHVFHIFHNLPYIFSHSHTQLIYIMLNATLIYIFVSIPQKCDLCVPRTRRARENEKRKEKGVSKISKIKKVRKKLHKLVICYKNNFFRKKKITYTRFYGNIYLYITYNLHR